MPDRFRLRHYSSRLALSACKMTEVVIKSAIKDHAVEVHREIMPPWEAGADPRMVRIGTGPPF